MGYGLRQKNEKQSCGPGCGFRRQEVRPDKTAMRGRCALGEWEVRPHAEEKRIVVGSQNPCEMRAAGDDYA